MLFLGCNQHYDPYIVFSHLFKDIPIFSDRNYCCGEPAFRLGLLEEARRCAFNFKEKMKELGVKRLLVFCPACYNTLTNIMPKSFDVEYGVEFVPLVSWLRTQLAEGSIQVKTPLNFTVNIQDSCHATDLGDEFHHESREVLRMLGVDIREMKFSQERMKCCGLGYASSRYSLGDVVVKGVKRARESAGANVDLTTTYCNGCYFTMNMMRTLYPFSSPVYHLVELVQIASGETPLRKMNRCRWSIIISALQAARFDLIKTGKIKIDI